MGSPEQWYSNGHNIQGFLLDIYGVLYDGGKAIPGSVEAIEKLFNAGIPVRFCTNTSTKTRAGISKRLCDFGYNVDPEIIFPPIPAVRKLLQERGLRPFLIVHEKALPGFDGVDQSDPNCVVIGDAGAAFSYESLNKAFRILIESDQPTLISMGMGKYYSDVGGLKLDVGVYMKALEFACDITSEVVGKPSKSFFMEPIKDMGLNPQNVVMIGDDITYDIGGAQECGMMGVLVRTGKYRRSDEPHPVVTPDGYVDNLAEAVDLFLQHR